MCDKVVCERWCVTKRCVTKLCAGGALGRRWSPLVARSRCTLQGRRGTWRHGRSICVGGAAFITLGWAFARPWHLATSTCTLRGRRGTWRHGRSICVAGAGFMTLGLFWWRAWAPLVTRGAAALCVAGVAFGDIHLHFARGRRGTYDTGLALVVHLLHQAEVT